MKIGKRTRQLLCHLKCALAIAPPGMRDKPQRELHKIGIGYDGGREADAALMLAGSLAYAANAALCVYSVVDDRVPLIGWSPVATGGAEVARWEEIVLAQTDQLREAGRNAARVTGATSQVEVFRGRPADALLAVSEELDLSTRKLARDLAGLRLDVGPSLVGRLLGFFWVGFYEEFLFRGIAFRVLEVTFGSIAALVPLVFGLLHLGTPGATLVGR